MATMNEEQIKLARHALGLGYTAEHNRSYRNRYHCNPGTPANDLWRDMVSNGFARGEVVGKMDFFYLTLIGAKAAIRDGESLDREDFPSA